MSEYNDIPPRVVQEIDRQNSRRLLLLTLIGLPLLGYLLTQELGYLGSTSEQLFDYFGEDVHPETFVKVVNFRLAAMLAMGLLALLAFLYRKNPSALHWISRTYIFATGLLLIAIASLLLEFRESFELFYLKVFLYCALFLMPPVMAVAFCTSAVVIYIVGANILMDSPTPSVVQALYFNCLVVAGLGLVVTIQNYRSKHAELSALYQLEKDHRMLAKAKSEIEASSERDALTGVYNRMKLQSDLDALDDHHRSYALAMIDIDHFKSYNDHHGHAAGDEVLRSVAQAFVRSLNRPSDQIYRYGGEEFLVVLPNTGVDDAAVVIDRMRRQVERMRIDHVHRPDDLDIVTITAGVADTSEVEPAQVLEKADQRLYEGKRAGRNRVEPQPHQ